MKTALALLILASPAFAGRQEKIRWSKDFDASAKQAKKDGKYIVLHFSGPN